MKQFLLTSVFAGVLFASAAAQAAPNPAPIAVDFSVLMVDGIDNVVDITTPGSIALNGVTFTYDNFGTTAFAQAQSFGIFGNPNNGVLEMAFDRPVHTLTFNYRNLSNGSGPVELGLLALMGFPDGELNGIVAVPGDLNADLTFDYTGPGFTRASFYFAVEALYFTVDSIVYTPVPEPISLFLLGSGLLGLGMLRQYRR